MNLIYNAFFNADNSDDVILRDSKEIGEEIHSRGGMDALRGCFYMMVIDYRAMIKAKGNKLVRVYQGQIIYWRSTGKV